MSVPQEYNHLAIEKKWQDFWDENNTFYCDTNSNKEKFYALDMFPYPSGAGLHVGHPEGYTASDIICRYKRMNDFEVLHPMGWDAFGLPAEQYAIQTKTHPAITTAKNIENFKRQIKALGFSYDWSREVNTTDPKYYKWTQWIFLQLYKKDLAYLEEVDVNWCPALGTVLANEEVINGRSERGNHIVEKRPMRQWMLKITEYAERLLLDLDDLDWPESIKEMQRNWIGKSVGAEVFFKVDDKDINITVYTTRPDTLFGATYLILAPENSLVLDLCSAEQRDIVNEYIKQVKFKSELERSSSKEKTGVFSGAYAINPVNQEKLPIYIADYVLNSYGTGAIMAVPAHDTRDHEFALKFSLPIKEVITSKVDVLEEAWIKDGKLHNSKNEDGLVLNGLNSKKAIDTVISWLEAKNYGKKQVNYKLRDWIFSRQRYWGEPFPLIHMEDGSIRAVDEEDLPVELPPLDDFTPSQDGQSALSKAKNWLNYTCKKTNLKGKRETNTMPQWAGSCWYYLRYLDPVNEAKIFDDEIASKWLPVDLYIGGAEHAVLHLLYARFWHKVLYDLDIVNTKEPFQKLYNQGMILGTSYKDSRGFFIANDLVESKGDKFFHKETNEELEQVPTKMSKALKNVVNPDDIVQEYGADSLRLYEMFMGPLNATKPWNTKGVEGVYRFLKKFYTLVVSNEGKLNSNILKDAPTSKEDLRIMHQTIKKVTCDINSFDFNTAISQMMICLNHLSKQDTINHNFICDLTLILSPFAPHVCEEIWQVLGNETTLSYHSWPSYNEEYLVVDEFELVIQVCGKIVQKIKAKNNSSKEELLSLALEDEKVKEKLQNKTVKRTIVVVNKLVNIVAV